MQRCKTLIREQLRCIIEHRQSEFEYVEGERFNDDGTLQNEGTPLRYFYSHRGEYSRLENNVAFNVIGGKVCEELNAEDFKICINELIAFQINSGAKFKKVYREGARKCFLMPAEFKDDVIRNFFRVKFEQFVDNARNSITKDDDYDDKLSAGQSCSISENIDVVEEHLEGRKDELQCSIATGFVCLKDAEAPS